MPSISFSLLRAPTNLKMRLQSSSPLHFNIACWNVLADCYAYRQPSKAIVEPVIPIYISWDVRKHKIEDSISTSGADILCLQEVDHYVDFYEPLFEKLGYKSLYLQRKKRQDGCLIAYNSEKFVVHGVDEVQFDDVADLLLSDSARTNVKRSNVALIALMSCKSDHSKKFVSATAHIYWNPRKPEVKSLQTQYLVSRIDSFIASVGLTDALPVFIAGDFNSVPFSEPYQMLVNGFENDLLKKGVSNVGNIVSNFYGPKTKFLCDRNLSRLCRWMRVLGIDAALMPDIEKEVSEVVGDGASGTPVLTSPKTYRKHKQSFEKIFSRARNEQRVILTTSTTMRERSMCPPSYLVSTRDLEAALIEICKEYGLALDQDKFLTVCGKCGGEIEACSHDDPRMVQNSAVPPLDREVFICKGCNQPYWWNERENSSPARAMKIADRLFNAVTKSGQDPEALPITDTQQIDSDVIAALEGGGNERKSISGPITFELSERITIAIQNTEMKEDNALLSAATGTQSSHLTALFEARGNTLRAVQASEESVTRSSVIEVSPDSALTALSQLSLTERESEVQELVVQAAPRVSSRSRKFISAYASVHDGKEPVTNWSDDFKDTLDYIFMSGDWSVLEARVVPRCAPEDATTAHSDSQSLANQDLESDGGVLFVDKSQPSDDWPSDHFMLVVRASF